MHSLSLDRLEKLHSASTLPEGLSRTSSMTATLTPMRSLPELSRVGSITIGNRTVNAPYLSFHATVLRNSNFVGLSVVESRELDVVELRVRY